MERLGLAITGGKSDTELAVTDDQPADDAWFDVEDEPEDDPWLGTDDEPVDDAGPVQATDGDPDAVVQSDVTSNQPIAPLGEQSAGDLHAESDSQQPEAAPSDQSEATSQPPPDQVAELLSGTDDELIAAIQ
jgi:hypothetical protein